MGWYLFLVASPIIMVPIVSSWYRSSINDNRRAKKTYLILCGLILFFMIALRHYSLGSVDSSNYYHNWIKLREMTYSSLQEFMDVSDMESGYLFTVWCLSRVFPSAQYVFVLTGLLFSVAICRTIYLNSEDVMLSMVMCICLGLYTFMIQGLRQAIAISICMLAIEACKKRKLLRFLVLILLAVAFHRTSFVFLPVYFLYGFNFTWKAKLGMVSVAAVLLAISPFIVTYGNEFLDRDYFTTVESGAVVAMLIYIIIVAVAFIFLNEKNSDKNTTFFVMITVLGMTFYLMRYIGAQALERISFYFLIGQAITLPAVIGKFEPRSKNIINMAVCVLSIALFVYRLYMSYGMQYIFFWQ